MKILRHSDVGQGVTTKAFQIILQLEILPL